MSDRNNRSTAGGARTRQLHRTYARRTITAHGTEASGQPYELLECGHHFLLNLSDASKAVGRWRFCLECPRKGGAA